VKIMTIDVSGQLEQMDIFAKASFHVIHNEGKRLIRYDETTNVFQEYDTQYGWIDVYKRWAKLTEKTLPS